MLKYINYTISMEQWETFISKSLKHSILWKLEVYVVSLLFDH